MPYDIKQSSTQAPLLFFMTDSTDHITGKTGLSPTVTISKAGGSFASPSGAVTEISSGWYKVAGNATDTGTLGPLALHATATGADACDIIVANIVAYDPQDSVRIGITALPNAAAEASGGLFTRGTGAGQINQDANGRIDANVKTWIGGAIPAVNTTGVPLVDTKYVTGTLQTARDLGASVLLSSGTGTGQVSLTSGKVDINDKTGFALSSAGVQAIWDALTSALTTVGSIGKLIVTNLDAAVSSRLASGSYTAPDNSSITAIKAKTDNLPASPAATSDIPSASTVAAAVWAYVVTGTTTAVQGFRGFLAVLLGKASGLDLGAPKYRDVADTKDVVSATTDANGNRSVVTLDLT